MSDEDIDAFVTAWHNAARLEYESVGDALRAAAECRRLALLERSLQREFDHNRVLRDLARTPLLCAVICALHRKREGKLPSTRWELYRATLDMLLGNRDRRRGIDAPEGLSIGVEEHKLLLQHIAVWLVRNGRTQLSYDEALMQIRIATLGMPQVHGQGTCEQILTHLLNRSGLLQEHAQGFVQFIHRTFQDYLAAKEFAETDSLAELLQRGADDEQWHDVLRLSVGHLDRRRVSTLIAELVHLGDAAEFDVTRRPLHLLAAQCAASAVYLDEVTRTATHQRVQALMPPGNRAEVREFAALGTFVLPLLPGPAGLSPSSAVLVVDTLALIGDEACYPRLREFVDHQRSSVRRALVQAWSSFPADSYAREILAATRLNDIDLKVTTPDQLHQVRHCTAPRLVVEGAHRSDALAAHVPRSSLQSLGLRGNSLLTELAFLQDQPALTRLSLMACPSLARFGDSALAAGLPLLTELVLDEGTMTLAGLPPSVRTIEIRGPSALDPGKLPVRAGVEHLRIAAPMVMSVLAHVVRRMPDVVRLSLETLGLLDLEASAEAPGIRALRFGALDRYVNTAALTRVFPSLQHLEVEYADRPATHQIDLSPLHGLPDVAVRLLIPPQVHVEITGQELLARPVEVLAVPGP